MVMYMQKPDSKALQLFLYYIGERKLIHDKKERGDSWPWTTDEILNEWSFTNVYRCWDKTTKHFVEKFYKPKHNAPVEEIALNCAAFRWFGTIAYADNVGWQTTFDPDRLLADVERVIASGVSVFTGAYKIPQGGKTGRKEQYVIPHVLVPYHRSIPNILGACATGFKKDVHATLLELPGFGDFMAKEVLEDMCLTTLLQNPRDADTYTPMGPGAIRGLERLYGDNMPVQQRSMLARVAYLRDQIQQHCGLTMNAHDVQFNLCEADKFFRTYYDEGKPKRRYIPSSPLRKKGSFFAV